MKTILLTFTVFFLFSTSAFSETSSINGIYAGEASTTDENTRIELVFEYTGSEANVRMNLLDIGVLGWPASTVSIEGNTIRLEFPSDSGFQKMILQTEGNRLVGSWKDSPDGTPSHVVLNQVKSSASLNETNIKIKGPAGNLGATIIMPEGKGPFPGVVFVHGSGPQSRDASRFAAQTFAKHGIASLIYDKRGVGESEGNWTGASFEDLAADAVEVARHFVEHKNIQHVGFWGHSQGGWVAPLAATKLIDSKFVITSAGPAVSPSREAEWDVVRQLRKDRISESGVSEAQKLIRRWHKCLRTKDWEGYASDIDSISATDWFDPELFSFFLTPPSEEFTTMYRPFMDYDPIPTLLKLNIPLLAIFTPDDESIDSLESIEILSQIAPEMKSIRILTFPGFNHSMRAIGKDGEPLRFPGHPKDYFSIQAAFILSHTIPQ